MTYKAAARRSALYLPANRESAVAKARTLAADCVILDLEDAVQPDAKDVARAAAVAALAAGGWGAKQLLLRVNGLGTPWSAADLAAAAGFAGVVVPKVESPESAAAAVAAAGGVPLWAMIETPAGVLAAPRIAAVPGVAALLAGTNDLAKDLRCRPDAARTPLLHSLSAIVLAARAAGVLAIDGVFGDIGDAAGFIAEAEQGRMLGFDGKSLIHPAQVDPCNRVFSPSDAEVATARGLIAAYEAGLAAGRGVTTFEGLMVEALHVEAARRVLDAAG
ncbi:HpcH/HpaI aldolase/citrate lyase family protein [Polymorphobacter fuscus]|uniref:CoA ester lyase n=1 Tax=Sandarakinorhabdus fusca TaxID=1439888 RepID=A0A7C9KXI2_9SPHN|nr:CoA ester lyase [Polymorphobacter fuscus]KAB7648241.1 CoA ester lyase [Polymorphobacter fuscus]MQT15748.1 CoA ester lyase [Polymorphobacter fuscus]NJC07981.1 citrate lyase beta subunit [Polymorphobacter fuscus]